MMTIDDQNRFTAALGYWLTQGETQANARELAIDQMDWEDSQGEDNRWKGSNDSLPIFHYAC